MTLCVSPRCRAMGQHASECADETCRGCLPRRADAGLALCGVCTRRLGEDIEIAAELHGELAETATGGSSAPTGRVSGATSEGSPMPNVGPISAQREIRQTLCSWARLVAEERGLALPADSVPAVAAWLGRHVEWLAAHGAAGDCADEMAGLARGRARSVAFPSGLRTIEVGQCPAWPDNEHQCPGRLRAELRATDSLLPSALVCSKDDGHRWTSAEWMWLGRALMGAAA